MERLEELKFHLSQFKWTNWVFLASLVILIGLFGANFPIGEKEIIKGRILSKNQTAGSQTDLPYPVARVKLSSGRLIDVKLPRNVYIKVGQEINLYKQKRAISGEFIRYDSTINP